MNSTKITILTVLFLSNFALAGIVEKDGGRSKSEDNLGDLIASSNDSFKDYYRDGRLVLRLRDRTASHRIKDNGQKLGDPERSVDLLVPIDGKVVFIIRLEGKSQYFELSLPSGVYISSGQRIEGGESIRWFHLCIPDKDYYEYVEAKGAALSFPAEATYAGTKKTFINIAKKGYITELQKGEEAEK